MSDMMKSIEQTKNAVVFVCNEFVGNEFHLGAIKLNKILWFADTEFFCHTDGAATITGNDRYIAEHFGPVLWGLPAILRQLEYEKILTIHPLDFVDYIENLYRIADQEAAKKITENIPEKQRKILKRWASIAGKTSSSHYMISLAQSYEWWDDLLYGAPIEVSKGAGSMEDIESKIKKWRLEKMRKFT